MNELLKFQQSNAKIKYLSTVIAMLPAGHTCPGAKDCKAMVDPVTGRLIDTGSVPKYRCYAASIETYGKGYRDNCWHNQRLLDEAGGVDGIAALIADSLDAVKGATRVRLHSGGDFYSQEYFDAWMMVAEQRPDILVYGYTKSLHFLIDALIRGTVPDNMRLIMSDGGKYDRLIPTIFERFPGKAREAVVVFHPDEADERGLVIDHDDETAALGTAPKFALLLHGSQPAGSDASAALKRMREEGVKYGY